MAGNNPLHQCQSNSCARKLFDVMKSLKWLKKLSGILHVESDPIIPYEKISLPEPLESPEFNFGLGLVLSELPGVLNEIFNGHSQEVRVPMDGDIWSDDPFHAAIR